MKLIITGHDLSGKSTYLNTIYTTGNTYMHLSYKDPKTYDFYSQLLRFSDFIMDRCFIDELIYPNVFKREQALSRAEANALLDYCITNNIKIVIFECSDEEIQRRLSSNIGREEPEVLLNLLEIKKQYKKLSEVYNIPLIDTTNKTMEELTKEIWGKSNG